MQSLGKRAQNRKRTRTALVKAARRLFEKRGFDEVRIEDITAAAGVGRRTFFRYFPSKADVAFPDHDARIAHFSTLLAERIPGEAALVAVQRALLTLGSEMMADADEVVAFQRIVDASPTLLAAERIRDREWDRALAQALSEDGGPSLHEWVVAGVVLGAVRAAMRVWLDDGGRDDLVKMGTEAFALLDRGLKASELS